QRTFAAGAGPGRAFGPVGGDPALAWPRAAIRSRPDVRQSAAAGTADGRCPRTLPRTPERSVRAPGRAPVERRDAAAGARGAAAAAAGDTGGHPVRGGARPSPSRAGGA